VNRVGVPVSHIQWEYTIESLRQNHWICELL